MKSMLAMILILPVGSCLSEVNETAICDATTASRTDHAAALAADGGDRSVVTGALLIRQIDAACQ
jgi:hypothetical protein